MKIAIGHGRDFVAAIELVRNDCLAVGTRLTNSSVFERKMRLFLQPFQLLNVAFPKSNNRSMRSCETDEQR